MKNTPNHRPHSAKSPSEPKFKPEIDQLPPIPEGIDALAKLPLPADPLDKLSPWARRLIEQETKLKEAKEHALYELDHIQDPRMNAARDHLQEKLHVNLEHTIEYLSENPHMVSKLEPAVRRTIIEHFPGFLLTLISHLEVAIEDAEKILHEMVQQLGARRLLLLAKTKDDATRPHVKKLVTDMGKKSEAALRDDPENPDAQALLDSSMQMLVAGVLDNLLHSNQLEKAQMGDFEKAIKLVLHNEYQNWTKNVLTQYPDKEILMITKTAMRLFPQEKFDEEMLARVSKEKKESIFGKIAPEMSTEELTKVLIKNETAAVREEILRKLGR